MSCATKTVQRMYSRPSENLRFAGITGRSDPQVQWVEKTGNSLNRQDLSGFFPETGGFGYDPICRDFAGSLEISCSRRAVESA